MVATLIAVDELDMVFDRAPVTPLENSTPSGLRNVYNTVAELLSALILHVHKKTTCQPHSISVYQYKTWCLLNRISFFM